MMRTLLAVALAVWLAADAAALEFKQLDLPNGRKVLLLRDARDASGRRAPNGGFANGDTRRFEQIVDRSGRIDEIWFDSGGGSEVEGYGIGRAIRKRKLATRVPSNGKCASACTDAFMGGVVRFVDDEKSIGIHMGTEAHSPLVQAVVHAAIELLGERAAEEVIREFEQNGARSAAAWTAYVMEMGVSIRLVNLASRVSSGSMHWLTWPEMRNLNVVNTRD